MVNRLTISSLILLFATLLPLGADEGTWIAPPSRGQLERDTTLMPKGKGFLFVPYMTSPLTEPNYLVYQEGKKIAEEKMGLGVLLSPGEYDILVGSGPIPQMMSTQVRVVEGFTSLLKSFWGGLIIEVIDQNRTSINESYELFGVSSQENYGIGFGIEEERGEAVRTWLLPAGTYEVVRVGDNISTTRKFSVRLEPGELVQRNLVVDEDNFVGFYPPSLQLRTDRSKSAWKSAVELSGSTLFNTTQNTAGEDRSSVSFSGQVLTSSRYLSERHLALLRVILEEGLTKEGNDDFRKSIDELEVRGTYIYRLSQRLGPYLRGVVNTKVFATDVRYDQPATLHLVNTEGDTTSTLTEISDFTLSKSLTPMRLRQGMGINSDLYQSFPLNVDVRIGLGARQTSYPSDAYDLRADRGSAQLLKSASSTGLEAVIVMDARLSTNLSLDAEFEILMPSATTSSWEFTWENRLRVNLSRYINMDIVLDFAREKPLKRIQSRQQVLLRFVWLL